MYIHLSGKYPRGPIIDSQYQELRAELQNKLKNLSFHGEKVVKEVYLKDDIFKGSYSVQGPDLYVLPNYGFDLKGAFNRDAIFGTTHFKGMHTHDDAHLFISDKHNNNNFRIVDIAEIVSKYLR